MIILSNSGETKELFDIINYCKRFFIKVVAITMSAKSTLSLNSDFLLLIPKIKEASTISAPTTSALMMLALGDAITIAVQEAKGFSSDDFRVYHPGGKIGANLIKIKELMYGKDESPIVYSDTSCEDAISVMSSKNLGCVVVVDESHNLKGIVTDGDLRRNIRSISLAMPVTTIMTVNPKSIKSFSLAAEGLYMMNSNSITVLPVVDDFGLFEGVVHIHTLLKAGVG